MADSAAAEQKAIAGTYLITVRCYGTLLHGQTGAVDRNHNLYGGPSLAESQHLAELSEGAMKSSAYELDAAARADVVNAIRDVCRTHEWDLWALHVRSNHWHAIAGADQPVELVMGMFKSNASRVLNEREGRRRPRWVRHGSTRHLWTAVQVRNAMRYVIAGQGDPRALYVNPDWRG